MKGAVATKTMGNIEKANPKIISTSWKWCQPGSQMSNRKKKTSEILQLYSLLLSRLIFISCTIFPHRFWSGIHLKHKSESISHLLMQQTDCHIWQARSKHAHKTIAGAVLCRFAWQAWNATVCCWKWQWEQLVSLLQNLQNYKWTTFPAWEKLQSTPFIGLQRHKYCLGYSQMMWK